MRVCIIFHLKNDSTIQRIGDDVPKIVATIKSISKRELLPVFRSNDGIDFGWFFEIDKPLGMLQAEIKGSTGFQNGDGMIVFDVAKGLGGIGFSRTWTWLQRHPE